MFLLWKINLMKALQASKHINESFKLQSSSHHLIFAHWWDFGCQSFQYWPRSLINTTRALIMENKIKYNLQYIIYALWGHNRVSYIHIYQKQNMHFLENCHPPLHARIYSVLLKSISQFLNTSNVHPTKKKGFFFWQNKR